MGESYYEYYLEHHGILGQKWGVRRYQNSDGSLTAVGRRRYASLAKSEAKAESSTGLRKQYHNYNAGEKRYEIERANRVKSAKGLGEKYSEAFGYKDGAAKYAAKAQYRAKNAEIAKTRYGRKRNEAMAFNDESMSKYNETMSKASTGEKIVENILGVNAMKMPIKTLSGRETTVGSEIVLGMFTAGIGNVIADKNYVSKTKKAAKAVYKEEKKAAKEEWKEASKKYADDPSSAYDDAADRYNERVAEAKKTYKRSY